MYALHSLSVEQLDPDTLKVETTVCVDEVQRRDCKETSDIGLSSKKNGGDLTRDEKRRACLVWCLAYMCAHDIFKWRKKMGSWTCRSQMWDSLGWRRKWVLWRESELRQDSVQPLSAKGIQLPKASYCCCCTLIGLCVYLFCLVFFFPAVSYSFFQWLLRGSQVDCEFVSPTTTASSLFATRRR